MSKVDRYHVAYRYPYYIQCVCCDKILEASTVADDCKKAAQEKWEFVREMHSMYCGSCRVEKLAGKHKGR